MSNVRKNYNPPQAGQQLDWDCLKILCWNFFKIPFMEDYFKTYLVCMEALLHMESYSEFQFAHMQNFHRLVSVEKCFCS